MTERRIVPRRRGARLLYGGQPAGHRRAWGEANARTRPRHCIPRPSEESVVLLPASRLSPLLNIRRAHALIFLDGADEAKALYLRYRSEKVDSKLLGEQLILHDFEAMRDAGLTHRLQDEIKTLFIADAKHPGPTDGVSS